MKVALYARESSDDTTIAPPVTEQINRGKQWAAENGHIIVETYVDNGFSGGDWNRPDWNRCIKDARRHIYTVLWVWNQDRIARDTEQFLFFYRNINSAKCRIFEDTSNDFIDMETLGGRVKHQTMAQAAEIFRLVTSDKVKQAYRRKKNKAPWGRPKKAFDIEVAKQLRSQGLGWRSIGQQLGVCHNTIRRALLNNPINEHKEMPQEAEANTSKSNGGIM